VNLYTGFHLRVNIFIGEFMIHFKYEGNSMGKLQIVIKKNQMEIMTYK